MKKDDLKPKKLEILDVKILNENSEEDFAKLLKEGIKDEPKWNKEFMKETMELAKEKGIVTQKELDAVKIGIDFAISNILKIIDKLPKEGFANRNYIWVDELKEMIKPKTKGGN